MRNHPFNCISEVPLSAPSSHGASTHAIAQKGRCSFGFSMAGVACDLGSSICHAAHMRHLRIGLKCLSPPCWLNRRGIDPLHVLLIPAANRNCNYARNVVGVLAISVGDDLGNKRCARVKSDPRLRLVVGPTLPPVDRSDRRDIVPTCDKSMLDERVRELGQPLRALGRDHDLDALQRLDSWLGHDQLAFSSFRSLSMRAMTSSSVRASALHPVMIGPS